MGGDNIFIIYKITNRINNLIYIGCTTKSLQERVAGHFRSINKQDDFHTAIRTFGKQNFVAEVLEVCEDDSLCGDRERYYIATYNSTDPKIGYNRTIGGNGTVGYEFTDEAKRKISLAGIGRKHSEETKKKLRDKNIGKRLTEEQKRKMSLARLGRFTGVDNPFYGKKHTEETKDKIRKSNSVPVTGCSNKDGTEIYFSSAVEAAKYIQSIRGGVVGTIQSHLLNSIKEINCKTAYGYKWRYAEKSNDYPDREQV